MLKYSITAIAVPRVTCDLPLQPVCNSSRWKHLLNLSLADPDFGIPGRIDLLLGADIYADVLLHGRWYGPPGTPTAFETQFEWVLTGRTNAHSASHLTVASHHSTVRRFISLERSLHSKGYFQEFSAVMEEYFQLGHAEPVPPNDLQKSPKDCFYLPMHAVRKEHSTTSKVRVVFDVSAKSASGVSLNDTLLVGPTIHPPLIDVLLRFRLHRVALTADISKMYRAIELIADDRDLHRFVWRKNPREPLCDYRMTRLTFGMSASSFAANMR